MSNGSPQSNDLISAFHDGELAEHDRKAVEQLLEDSADSRAELEDYRALSELMRELPAVSAPEDLRAAVMRRIERQTPPPSVPAPASKPRSSWRVRIALIATALTAAAALLVILIPPNREQNLPLVATAENEDATAPPELVDSEALYSRADFSDRPADATSGSEFFDALGGAGGVPAAGPAARPPEGFSIGDVYTYLEQTPDGDVMVVNAVVVDVRRALNQLQVLLSESKIPTVSVAVNNEYAFEYRGAAASGTTAGDATQDVALYVESDPVRINAALESLGKEDEFLSWRYAGVLDQSQPAARMSTLSYYNTLPASDAAESYAAEVPQEMERAEVAPSGAQPAARASVTDRSFRRDLEGSIEADEILPPTTARNVPFGQSAPAGQAGGDVEMKQGVAESVDVTNGYQTILNVPRAALEQQLTVSNAASEPAETRAARFQESRRGVDEVEPDMKLAEEPQKRQLGERLTRDRQPGNAVPQLQQQQRLQQQQQRRLRLLFVLEPEPTAGTAAKAKADQQQAPVEAPLPIRKKG